MNPIISRCIELEAKLDEKLFRIPVRASATDDDDERAEPGARPQKSVAGAAKAIGVGAAGYGAYRGHKKISEKFAGPRVSGRFVKRGVLPTYGRASKAGLRSIGRALKKPFAFLERNPAARVVEFAQLISAKKLDEKGA